MAIGICPYQSEKVLPEIPLTPKLAQSVVDPGAKVSTITFPDIEPPPLMFAILPLSEEVETSRILPPAATAELPLIFNESRMRHGLLKVFVPPLAVTSRALTVVVELPLIV